MLKFYEKKDSYETLIETYDDLFKNKYIPALMDLIFEGKNEDEIGKPLEMNLPRTKSESLFIIAPSQGIGKTDIGEH